MIEQLALEFATKAHKGQKRKNHINCPDCEGRGWNRNLNYDSLSSDEICTTCEGKRVLFPDYITHPIAVSDIAEEIFNKYTYDHDDTVTVAWIDRPEGTALEVIKAAALLHDVIEDCGITHEHIHAEFGKDIAHIVTLLSHDKDNGASYLIYITTIMECDSTEAKIIKLADVTHNLSTWPNKSGSMRDKWELTKYMLEKNLKL